MDHKLHMIIKGVIAYGACYIYYVFIVFRVRGLLYTEYISSEMVNHETTTRLFTHLRDKIIKPAHSQCESW